MHCPQVANTGKYLEKAIKFDIIGISIKSWCRMVIIEQLKALNKPENIAITEHARIRLYERKISIDDIVSGINTDDFKTRRGR